MKTLSQNWFTEGLIDFEFKKYILLAYLQDINQYFHKNKLYPQLSELIFHYNNLLLFRDNKETLQNNFPERLTDADFNKLKLSYEKIIGNDAIMQEIENIINYSISEMSESLKEGREIYEFVEEQLSISPVGLIPLFPMEGYLFIRDGKNADTKVYEYQITIFESQAEKFRGIHTRFLCSYQKNFINTFESIKIDLLRNNPKLPNPAVYAAETELTFPINETLLPIAKRSLVKYIATNTA